MKGLGPEKKDALDKIVKLAVEENIGREMIYDLATAIHDYLENIALVKGQDAEKPSLIEERALKAAAIEKELLAKEEQARSAAEEKRLKEERKQQKAYEEHEKRRKEQAKEMKVKTKTKVEFMNIDDDDEDEPQHIKFDRKITVKNDADIVHFNKVTAVMKLGKGALTKVYLARPVLLAGRDTDVALSLKEADVLDPHMDCQEGKRHLVDLEADLDKLRSFQHSSVLQIYDYLIKEQPPKKDEPTKGWKVSILMELSSKGSLGDLLQTVDVISPQMTRVWTVQLLEGLEAIHKEGLVHRSVHTENIFLFQPASGGRSIVKLADVSLSHRLWLMKYHKTSSQASSAHAKSTFWLPPEQADSDITTKKADVWNLGVVVVQMLFGLETINKYRSPKELMDELELSELLLDFLAKLFRQDPKKRPTPFELLPSEFLRSDSSIWEQDTSAPHSPTHFDNSFLAPTPRKRRDSNIGPDRLGSRYETEFTEGGRLGKGGFGEVVKARHKIDGRVYAIKKVHQAGTGSLDQVLSEVMLLSRISHQYVVRYYGAWIEEDRADMIFQNSTSDEYSVRSLDPDKSHHMGNASRGLDFISSTGFEIEFGYDEDEDDEDNSDNESDDDDSNLTDDSDNSQAIVFEDDSDADGDISATNKYESEDYDKTGDLEEVDNLMSTSPRATKLTRLSSRESRRLGATLYIQMEYCEKQVRYSHESNDVFLKLIIYLRLFVI